MKEVTALLRSFCKSKDETKFTFYLTALSLKIFENNSVQFADIN